jgi:hypothetical protein
MQACPECGRAEAPGIARRIVLPGDRRADEIALEILACACGFKAIAVTEQPRRASLKNAAPERVGYRLPAAAVDLLAFLIARCPKPAEEYCSCDSHAVLNRRDLRNQWNLLHSFAPFPGFALGPAAARAAGGFAYASVEWRRNGGGHAVAIEGREWHLHPTEAAARYELEIGDALVLELDRLPEFWRLEGTQEA